jgi:hypothetical protein
VARSENPFKPAFWIGTVDPRALGLFRITLGLTILHDLVNYSRDLRAFLTDEGMLPRGVVHDAFEWSVFDWVGTSGAVWLVFLVGCAVVGAFTVGYRTRLATVASWLFLASLHHRNHYVTDGGDDLARILLFWGMFADLGAAYGVDAHRRLTRVVDVPALGLRILQLQIAALYFGAARLKLRAGWLHGDNIFDTLQLVGFARPLGGWLLGHPALCKLLTRATVVMEGLFAFAAFSPVAVKPSRAAAIAFGALVQLGILFTMRVGIFTEAVLASMCLFVVPEWLDRVEAWVRLTRGRAEDDRPTASVPFPRWRQLLGAAVLVEFVASVWGLIGQRRFPLPRPVVAQLSLLDLRAKYGLFDVTYDIARWEAQGVLADGTRVEVLPVAAPGTAPEEPGYVFSRWYKFTCKEREFPFRYPELGAYFCRTYDERTSGAHLAQFTLVAHEAPPRAPGDPPPESHDRVLWSQECPVTGSSGGPPGSADAR